MALIYPLRLASPAIRTQRPVSRKSRKRFGHEKPFVKLRTANSTKLIFSYVGKGKQLQKKLQSFVPRDAFVLKIQRELGHPKRARKVSGLSRDGSLISTFPPSTIHERTRIPN